jgi:hypothetical protein
MRDESALTGWEIEAGRCGRDDDAGKGTWHFTVLDTDASTCHGIEDGSDGSTGESREGRECCAGMRCEVSASVLMGGREAQVDKGTERAAGISGEQDAWSRVETARKDLVFAAG